MKVAHIVAGAGGMYCGSCLHGNTLVAALSRAGCDAVLVPAYTPLRTDEEDRSVAHVVYGGINVYLQQASGLFARLPRAVQRLLDRPGLLRWVGRRSSSTRAETLGPLTVSMLRGEHGRQGLELDKLVDWLQSEVRPDLVHLNNALLAGMARRIHERLGVPVVCDLSGEDVFVEKLPEPHYSEVRALLRERCGELAALVAMNGYFADFMAEYLSVPRERIHVIPPGLDLRGYPTPAEFSEERFAAEPVPPSSRPRTIGFLGRICHDKGLHILAEAFERLCAEPGLPPVRLEAAGFLGETDRGYFAVIERRLRDAGLDGRFAYRGEPDRAGKIDFLRSLYVLAAPAVYCESKGLPVVEAWAAGTPAVLPDHGAFPEMIADTGGGLLHAPGDPAGLAAAIRRLIDEPQHAAACARRAHQAVHERYTAARMAEQTLDLYRQIL